MLSNQEITDRIKTDKRKKTVSWNDKKVEGKIQVKFLEINEPVPSANKPLLDISEPNPYSFFSINNIGLATLGTVLVGIGILALKKK